MSAGGAGAPAVPLRGSPLPLVKAYDTALLDLDGVVYVGQHAVPVAPAALASARAAGMRLAFVTNNAARTPSTVASHLTRLGVPAAPEDVVTSAQAAARVASELVAPGAAVLVVGGQGLEVAVRERRLRPVDSAGELPAAVVQGFAPEVNWRLLAEGAFAVQRGLPWIAANLDRTIPLPEGQAPGNGALVEVIRIATGRDPTAVAGKPELPLHQESIRRSGAQVPVVVGDRLDTDIEGAARGGVDSLLVLSGVTDPEELLHAPRTSRPTYLAPDVAGLLSPHPSIEAVGDQRWRCGGWTASTGAGALLLEGDGDPHDGLRAACAAAWTTSGPLRDLRALQRLALGATAANAASSGPGRSPRP